MRLLATAISSVLLALALPNDLAPYGIWALGLFCLAPYFLAVSTCRTRRGAAFLGFVFGTLAHALSSFWLLNFQGFAIWTIGASSAAYGFLQAIVAIFLHRYSRIERSIPGKESGWGDILRPFLLAAVWTVWECLKSRGFFGYPWGLVAYSFNDVPCMIQTADTVGVYGLSFLLALTSALLAEIGRLAAGPQFLRSFRERLIPVVGVTVAIFAIYMAYGAFRLLRPTPVVDTVPMVLVQHNADSWEHNGETKSIRKAEELSRAGIGAMKLSGSSPALLVWSETVLRRSYEDFKPYYRRNPAKDPFIHFLSEVDCPLLVGAPVILSYERFEATNSVLLIDNAGEVRYSYAKQHPVPMAEAIPLWEYRWMRDFMQKVIGLESGWVMGTKTVIMEVQTASGRPLKFGTPICFEDAFADVCTDFFRKGADILVNLTNDSWSKTISSETQHLVASRFRTVENRRVLVRSTNGGVTAVIDAEGTIVASLPLFAEGILPVQVPVQKAAAPTAYAILGDWFPLALALALFVWLIALVRIETTRPQIRVTDLEPLSPDEDIPPPESATEID